MGSNGRHGYTASEESESTYERLLAMLQRHAQQEEPALREYARFAEEDPDPVVRLMMGLVVEDEHRHHSLFDRMIRTLGDASFAHDTGSLLPGEIAFDPPADTVDLLRGFAEAERRGAEAMQAAADEHTTFYEGVFRQLLSWMAADSLQHAQVIDFLADRLTKGGKPSITLISAHRRIEQALRDFLEADLKAAERSTKVAAISAALEKLLRIEEEHLFPLLADGPLADRVKAAIEAHDRLRDAIRPLDASTTRRDGARQGRDAGHHLLSMLHDHAVQEEFVLYRALDELAARPGFPDVNRLLADDGKTIRKKAAGHKV